MYGGCFNNKTDTKSLINENNIINRELSAYRSLLRTIRGSVEDLLANIDGKYPREFEIEALWNKI